MGKINNIMRHYVSNKRRFASEQYDTMEYRKQVETLRQANRAKAEFDTMAERLCGLKSTDRLNPVYTLCLYHGTEEWTGPHSLKDMMNFNGDHDGMSRFFSDYPMQLFYVNQDTDLSVFHTEIREVFEALKYRKDKKKFRQIMEHNPAYSHLDRDTAEVMTALLNAPEVWEKRKQYMKLNSEDEEEYDMIPAWQEILVDERTEGMKEGMREGKIEAQTTIIRNMIKRGFSDEDICSLAECSLEKIAEIRQKNFL